jgi:iron(III) transport system substrate-binding protein
VFFSQDAGALGAVSAEGRLAAVPQDLLDRVDARFRSAEGQWVGVSGRARVAAYDTRELQATDLPASVADLAKPEWKGRVGWVPTNASFQSFVTAFRKLKGDEAAKAWLEAMKANEPKVYEGNSAAVQAVAAGEIDVALVNHYYALVAGREAGADLPVANHFFTGGDPGALINVAGAAILTTADHPAAARALIDYLLSTEGQTYLATETFEYPLAEGVALDPKLRPLAEIDSPDLDLADLADLQATLDLLEEVGLL